MRNEKSFRISLVCFAACILVGYARSPKKIMGGKTSYPGEFPYVVSIRLADRHMKYPDRHICGGSIIDEYLVLTAEHCVQIEFEERLKILSGTNDQEDTESGHIHKIARIHRMGQEYDRRKEDWGKDIAIVRLNEPMVFNKLRQPIRLPLHRDIPEGASATIIGWGAVNTEKNYPSKLLNKVEMSIIGNKECEIHLDYKYGIRDYNICAMKGRKIGPCKGDSGSPMIYREQIVGVASWGGTTMNECNYDDYPSVFSRIYDSLPWIKDIIANHNFTRYINDKRDEYEV